MKFFLQTGRLAVLTLSALYGLGLLAWRALSWLNAPRLLTNSGPWRLLAMIGVWIYLPLGLLLIVSAALRSGRAGALLVGPLLLFLADYGALYLPRTWRPQPRVAQRALDNHSGTPLRVMSWNAQSDNANVDALVSALERLRPDVVAIQESGIVLSTTLPTRVGERYPYQEHYPTGKASGMAILSRYPLLDAQRPHFRSDRESCNCQQVTLDLNGRPVTLISAHPWPANFQLRWRGPIPIVLGFNPRSQNRMFKHILARVEATQRLGMPLLLVGDFNTTEGQPNYRRLRQRLGDAFASAGVGPGFTWPHQVRINGMMLPPLLRIDHIYYSNAWLVRRAFPGNIAGSDHRYVVADLVLQDTTATLRENK